VHNLQRAQCVKLRFYYAANIETRQGLFMFKSLADFCKKQTRGVLSITTLYYMEQIDELDGATIGHLIVDPKDRGNINKMLASHEQWFTFAEPTADSNFIGRPGRRIYLSREGKKVLTNAQKGYLRGCKGEN